MTLSSTEQRNNNPSREFQNDPSSLLASIPLLEYTYVVCVCLCVCMYVLVAAVRARFLWCRSKATGIDFLQRSRIHCITRCVPKDIGPCRCRCLHAAMTNTFLIQLVEDRLQVHTHKASTQLSYSTQQSSSSDRIVLATLPVMQWMILLSLQQPRLQINRLRRKKKRRRNSNNRTGRFSTEEEIQGQPGSSSHQTRLFGSSRRPSDANIRTSNE
jgi:hypothetical protein